MNDAKFYLLSKLLKDHRTISKNDYKSIVYYDSKLKESIDFKEFDNETFFTDAYIPIESGKGGLHDKFSIRDEYDDIYKTELDKRAEKKEEKKLQYQLTKSSINANLFIRLSFGASILVFMVSIISLFIQYKQTQLQQQQLQENIRQSQQLKLQDSLLIEHSRWLEILKSASLQKKLSK